MTSGCCACCCREPAVRLNVIREIPFRAAQRPKERWEYRRRLKFLKFALEKFDPAPSHHFGGAIASLANYPSKLHVKILT